jgi:glycosyltransferase involved in cell wall biosynthesis
VAVSRHDPRKGVHILLRSLARLKELGVPFRACLIGRGQLLEEHRRLMRELRLDRVTVIAGLVDDPREFLRCAEIFVLPSLEESSGSVSLIEAMQAGLACVASAIDGIPEDVTEGASGLLVEPGSVDSLTEGLRRVLVNKELRSQLRKGARARFDERFASERFTASLGEVYRECLAGA